MSLLGSNIDCVHKIANQFGVMAFSCCLHLAGTLRNMLVRGLAAPVHHRTVFDNSQLNSFSLQDCNKVGYNNLRLEIPTIAASGSLTLKIDGKPLLALQCRGGHLSFDSLNSSESQMIGTSNNNDQFSLTVFRPNTAFSSISCSVTGQFSGTLKISVIQQFGMDVLKHIFQHDNKFQTLVRWTWLSVTDKQSELQIVGVCTAEVIDYLQHNYPQYSALITFLKDIMNPLIWTAYQRDSAQSDPVGVLSSRFTSANNKIAEWKYYFRDIRPPQGFDNMICVTDNAIRSISINRDTLVELSRKTASRTGLAIDPHVFLNKQIEGLFGEMRRISYTFNARQVAVLVSRLLHLRLHVLNPDRAHHTSRNAKSQRYIFFKAMHELKLSPSHFSSLKKWITNLVQPPEKLEYSEKARDIAQQLCDQCRSMIVRSLSLRASYYKLQMDKQLM